MVDLTRASIVKGEDTDCLVKGCSHEFTTCRCEIDVEDSLNMVLMHHLCLLELPHIKGVTVSILIPL
jgi:hypothetical protein